MFSKTSTQRPPSEPPATAAAPARPAKPVEPAGTPKSGSRRFPSLISQDLTIVGNLISKGELQVDGKVQGDIRGTNIVLGTSGEVTGNIIGDIVRVAGKVSGTIDAANVELDQSARVSGDIRHDALSVVAGAYLVGKVLRRDSTSGVLAAKQAAEPGPPTRDEATAPGGETKGKSPGSDRPTGATAAR